MAARAQATAAMDSAMTEEEKLKAMLKMTDAQWQQKQEEMSHDQRINPSGQRPGKKANVPEGEPPHGYICFRCMKRGKLVALHYFFSEANMIRTLDSGLSHQRRCIV